MGARQGETKREELGGSAVLGHSGHSWLVYGREMFVWRRMVSFCGCGSEMGMGRRGRNGNAAGTAGLTTPVEMTGFVAACVVATFVRGVRRRDLRSRRSSSRPVVAAFVVATCVVVTFVVAAAWCACQPAMELRSPGRR
jgi:hypothetical protein